jgi:hypothetical protein
MEKPGVKEAPVAIPSEAAFTIRKPTAGWQVELPTRMDEIDYEVSSYSLQRGKSPGMAMRVTTCQILGSLLSKRVPVNREEDMVSGSWSSEITTRTPSRFLTTMCNNPDSRLKS